MTFHMYYINIKSIQSVDFVTYKLIKVATVTYYTVQKFYHRLSHLVMAVTRFEPVSILK